MDNTIEHRKHQVIAVDCKTSSDVSCETEVMEEEMVAEHSRSKKNDIKGEHRKVNVVGKEGGM